MWRRSASARHLGELFLGAGGEPGDTLQSVSSDRLAILAHCTHLRSPGIGGVLSPRRQGTRWGVLAGTRSGLRPVEGPKVTRRRELSCGCVVSV